MKIALIGYGKMGKAIEEVALQKGHEIVLKIDVSNAQDFTGDNIQKADVAIEFTGPHSALDNLKKCIAYGVPVVSGSTGWLEHWNEIETACKEKNGCLVYSSNYSIGVNLFFELNKYLKYSVLGLFIILASYLYNNGQLSSGYINSYSSISTDLVLEKINYGRESSSAFYEKHYTSSILNNVFYAFPIDFVNFYFRPFVLPLSNAYARLQRYPYGLMSLFLFYLLIKKFKYMNSFEKKLLWLLILGMLPFVIGSGDLFQAVRHRMNFFTLNVILIGILLQNKRLKKLDDVR